MSAPTEVPVVEEFHKAMMNSYNTSADGMLNNEVKNVVDALNVLGPICGCWCCKRIAKWWRLHPSLHGRM